jgi:hypothetical protein
MAKLIIKEVNCETGEELEREMTAAEEKSFSKVLEEQEKRAIEANQLAETKADALAALGITEEQLQALLG